MAVRFANKAFVAVLLLAFAGAMAQAQEGGRVTGLKLDGKKPIQIESNKLEVMEKENVAIFTGNVLVVQTPTTLKAGRMKVFYKQNSGSAATGSAAIDRLEIDGKVLVRSEKQTATADSAVFDMDAQLLVMSGKEVVLSEGDNIIKGCKLTVKTDTGVARLEGCGSSGAAGSGRVKMLLNPNSRN